MKHLIIAAVSLTSVTTPVAADRHCEAPEPPFIVFNLWEHPAEVRYDREQAHLLTYSDFLHERNLRNLEICRIKGEDYDYNCDSPAYGEMGDINPDYLGLSEEEFLERKDANRLRAIEFREAFASCVSDD